MESFCTTSFGTPAGVKKPSQLRNPNCGKPASAKVGTAGSSGWLSGMARALILPALICAARPALPAARYITWMSPLKKACIAVGPPLKGMKVIFNPVSFWIHCMMACAVANAV